MGRSFAVAPDGNSGAFTTIGSGGRLRPSGDGACNPKGVSHAGSPRQSRSGPEIPGQSRRENGARGGQSSDWAGGPISSGSRSRRRRRWRGSRPDDHHAGYVARGKARGMQAGPEAEGGRDCGRRHPVRKLPGVGRGWHRGQEPRESRRPMSAPRINAVIPPMPGSTPPGPGADDGNDCEVKGTRGERDLVEEPAPGKAGPELARPGDGAAVPVDGLLHPPGQ